MHRMRWWQIRAAIRGLRRAERTQWTTTRWHAWIILCALGSRIDNAEELIRFPWEKNKSKAELEEEAKKTKELIERCKQENSRRK